MKRHLSIFFVLLIAGVASAQVPTVIKTNTEYERFGARKTFHIPLDTTGIISTQKNKGYIARKGDILYIWSITQNKWIPFVNGNGQLINGQQLFAVDPIADFVDGGLNIDTLTFKRATAIQDGYLKATDFTNFLAGYNKRVVSVAFSDTTTKTLTITYGDGTTTTATFTDLQSTGAAGSLADGDYGDITVSGAGSVWNITGLAVGTAELASNAVTLDKISHQAHGMLLAFSPVTAYLER